MSDDIIERVTARWAEYGLPGSGKPIRKQRAPAGPVHGPDDATAVPGPRYRATP